MWNMDPNEALLARGVGGGNTEGFIDRSKVRILLCDSDMNSSEEVFNLLCKCSYQVTSVKSPRQVIDALNTEGPDIDIILSEVDLPLAKGFKMLKYIMRDKDLRRIPVIMMSAQDEVALVVKCLRLGAADYLVKPLRTNELLNLWTHMWRRRRMLGLAEKNIMNCEFDVVPSDHSDANTNSTTLFSDDTDDNSHKSSNPEISVSVPREDESNMILDPALVKTLHVNLSDDRPNVPEINEQQRAVYPGKIMFGPKKSELRIGQSSAFFTYVKSSMVTSTIHEGSLIIDETTPPLLDNKLSLGGQRVDGITINLTDENATQYVHVEEKVSPWGDEHMISDTQTHDHSLTRENFNSNNSFPDSMSVDASSTPTLPPESSQQISLPPEFSQPMNSQQSGHNYYPDISGYNPYSAYPYYLPGPANHVMMSSIYQQHMSVPHCPPHHMPGMASFPYYPVNLCLPGQMPPGMHPWPSYGSSSNDNVKVVHKLDRREAALLKFRQKKKERCFDKKIRYVNRKKLAERRPRVRGQFVRKINGINVDLNGQPTSTDFDEDDDDDNDEEEDQAGRDSSPENNYATFHV